MNFTPVGPIKTKLRPLTNAELFAEFGGVNVSARKRKNTRKSLEQTQNYRTSTQPGYTVHRSAPRALPVRVADMPGFNRFFNFPKTTQKSAPNSSATKTKNVQITGNASFTQQQFQHSRIRKALNFMSKPETQPVQIKIPSKPKCKVVTPKQKRKSIRGEKSTSPFTPVFVKPGTKVLGRKSILYRPVKSTSPTQFDGDKNNENKKKNSRISGVCELQSMPTTSQIVTEIPEYKSSLNDNFKDVVREPQTKHLSPLTECSNLSTDSSDRSFLQLEKENLQTIANNAENISVSTPFKHYRPVKEFFDVSNNAEISFNTRNIQQEQEGGSLCEISNNIKDETVIAKLCDMMSKAEFRSECDEEDRIKKVKELTEMKQELEKSRSLLQKQRHFLILNLKSNEKAIERVDNLLKTYNSGDSATSHNNGQKTNNHTNHTMVQQHREKCETTFKMSKLPKFKSVTEHKQRTVFLGHREKTSPSFAVPRKTPCLRKRTLYKSLPMNLNKTSDTDSENVALHNDPAVSVYMQMKKSWSFLRTPKKPVKCDSVKSSQDVNNTPSSMATSLNLQRQLDKLYNGDSP